MSAETVEKRHHTMMRRFEHATRLLDAIELLGPENFANWLEHLSVLFDNIDTRLGRIEKRLDAGGIPLLADGIPDDEVPAYLALYAVNPVTAPEWMDPIAVIQNRLAAYRDARPAGEETSS